MGKEKECVLGIHNLSIFSFYLGRLALFYFMIHVLGLNLCFLAIFVLILYFSTTFKPKISYYDYFSIKILIF